MLNHDTLKISCSVHVKLKTLHYVLALWANMDKQWPVVHIWSGSEHEFWTIPVVGQLWLTFLIHY